MLENLLEMEEREMDKGGLLKAQKELISLYDETKYKDYNILNSEFMFFLKKRTEYVEESGLDLEQENYSFTLAKLLTQKSDLFLIFHWFFYGLGKANYPVPVTFAEDYKFIGLGLFLGGNILLSFLGMFFLTSWLTFLAICCPKNQVIRIFGASIILGVLLSYLLEFSFILPFAYLDTTAVTNGFFRTIYKINFFNSLFGGILLLVIGVLLNGQSLKSLRRNTCLKLKD